MDHFVVEAAAEELSDLLGAEAANLVGVGGGVVRETASELPTLRVADADNVPLLELSLDHDDADGQKALVTGFESLAGPFIDHELAARACR